MFVSLIMINHIADGNNTKLQYESDDFRNTQCLGLEKSCTDGVEQLKEKWYNLKNDLYKIPQKKLSRVKFYKINN